MKKKSIAENIVYLTQSMKYDWRQWVSTSFVVVTLIVGILFGTICALDINVDISFFGNYTFFAVGVVITTLYHRARTAEAEAKADEATRNEEAAISKANSRVGAKDNAIQQLQNQISVLTGENAKAQTIMHKAKVEIFNLKRRNAKLERDLNNANAFIEYLRNPDSMTTDKSEAVTETSEPETAADSTVSASVEDNTPGIDDPDFTLITRR